MLTVEEIKKLDGAGINKKIGELKKDYFEKRQKLLRGEHKDISEFKKIKRTIARLLTILNTLPATEKAVVAKDVLPAKTGNKVEAKAEKAEKKVAKKAVKKETTEEKTEKEPKAKKPAVKKPVKKEKSK
jgi:ribosomal protein L29